MWTIISSFVLWVVTCFHQTLSRVICFDPRTTARLSAFKNENLFVFQVKEWANCFFSSRYPEHQKFIKEMQISLFVSLFLFFVAWMKRLQFCFWVCNDQQNLGARDSVKLTIHIEKASKWYVLSSFTVLQNVFKNVLSFFLFLFLALKRKAPTTSFRILVNHRMLL